MDEIDLTWYHTIIFEMWLIYFILWTIIVIRKNVWFERWLCAERETTIINNNIF